MLVSNYQPWTKHIRMLHYTHTHPIPSPIRCVSLPPLPGVFRLLSTRHKMWVLQVAGVAELWHRESSTMGWTCNEYCSNQARLRESIECETRRPCSKVSAIRRMKNWLTRRHPRGLPRRSSWEWDLPRPHSCQSSYWSLCFAWACWSHWASPSAFAQFS